MSVLRKCKDFLFPGTKLTVRNDQVSLFRVFVKRGLKYVKRKEISV